VISNNFHGTEARVRAGRLSPSTVRRVRRILCGSSDCTCGGALGQRGSQLQPSGRSQAVIDPCSDGVVVVTWVNLDGNRIEV
jgi:hypothetical protein